MGVIWAADIGYKGRFLAKENLWQSHPLCFCAAGILLFSTFLGQSLLLFLSVSRLMTVLHPVETHFKTLSFVLECIFLIYTSAFLFGLGLTLMFFLTHHELQNILCLPFVDQTGSVLLVQIVTSFSASTQTVVSTVIMVLHVLLVVNLKASQEIRRSSTGDHSNIPVIIQFALITSTNILCWFPVNCIYIAAMFLPKYPIDLIVWSSVVVAPINSVINPLIFIVASIRKYLK